MAKIEIIYNCNLDLTRFLVTGEVTVYGILDVIKKFYNEGPVTKNTIWDMTKGSAKEINGLDVQQISILRESFEELRLGGKDAIITRTEADFGIARMVDLMTNFKMGNIVTKVFRNLEDAENWIKEKE